MKKSILILLSLFAIATSASAQEFKGWTLKAGANYSNIETKSNKEFKYNHKFGFTAGVSAEWAYTDIWGISADLLYSSQGGEIQIDNKIKVVENSNYISLPIMANLYITEWLTAKAGVQFSAFISGEDTITGTTNPRAHDLISSYNNLDISIPVGLAYEFDFGLIIEARYNFGLMNIVKESPSFPDFKAYNSFASITVGYRLNFK